MKRRTYWKAFFLFVFIVAAIGLVRFTPVKDVLTTEKLGHLIEGAGPWAPLVYMVGYAVGVCLLVPGTLLAVIGAAIFGPYLGFILVWVGAMLGAIMAFIIGRYLGRDFAATLIGERLRHYDEAIMRNGLAATLYLRLIYFPFNVMNFGMGLTSVRFLDYLLGTALGILVGTFIFTFFVGTIKEIYAGGRWEELLGWRVIFSVGLFISSFFIPKVIKRIKGDTV